LTHVCTAQVSEEVTIPASREEQAFALMVATYEARRELDFDVRVYIRTTRPLPSHPSPWQTRPGPHELPLLLQPHRRCVTSGDEAWHVYTVTDAWRVSDGTAGGCGNFATHWRNPQYLVRCEQACDIVVVLRQTLCDDAAAPAVPLTCMGFKLAHMGDRRLPLFHASSSAVKCQPSTFSPVWEVRRARCLLQRRCGDVTACCSAGQVAEEVRLEAGWYTLMPSTFEQNVERGFTLTVFSSAPLLSYESSGGGVGALKGVLSRIPRAAEVFGCTPLSPSMSTSPLASPLTTTSVSVSASDSPSSASTSSDSGPGSPPTLRGGFWRCADPRVGVLPHAQRLRSRWSAADGTAGGSRNLPTHSRNPRLRFRVDEPTAVFVSLSLPVDATLPSPAPHIAVHVIPGRGRCAVRTEYVVAVEVSRGRSCRAVVVTAAADVSHSMTCEPRVCVVHQVDTESPTTLQAGTYDVVASTWDAGVSCVFDLTVMSSHALHVLEST
jgi:hypothetical protein